MLLHSHLFLSSNPSIILPHSQHPSTFLSPPSFPSHTKHKTIKLNTYILAQLTEPNPVTTMQEDGPVELPPSSSSTSLFATTDDPTPLQIATSVLLTGAITVFLFRSVRRRAKRAKELKYRSSGAKSIKDEALDNLKAMKLAADDPTSPPSPVQALLGGIAAGVITLILYKFATTVEAGLNRQTISDNFSVRQITITIRTIINGICYLATFVFGINSIGLILYAGQLAINSFLEEGSTSEATSSDDDKNSGTSPVNNSSTDNEEVVVSDTDTSEKNQ